MNDINFYLKKWKPSHPNHYSWKRIWNEMKPKTFNDLLAIYAGVLVGIILITIIELIKIGAS